MPSGGSPDLRRRVSSEVRLWTDTQTQREKGAKAEAGLELRCEPRKLGEAGGRQHLRASPHLHPVPPLLCVGSGSARFTWRHTCRLDH